MKFLALLLEIARLVWVVLTLVVLFLFSAEVSTEAGTLLTAPYLVAQCAFFAQLVLLYVFAFDGFATMLACVGAFTFAEKLLSKIIDLMSRTLGDHAPGVVAKRAHLANLYLQEKNTEKAETIFNKILEDWKRTSWSLFSPACRSLASYAKFLKKTGRKEESEKIQKLIKGWEICAFLPALTMVLIVLSSATYLAFVKQLEFALSRIDVNSDENHLRRAVVSDLASIEGQVLGPTAPARLYHGEAWLAYFPIKTRDDAQTEWAVLRAIPLARKSTVTAGNLSECLLWLGEIYADRDELDRAEPLLKESLDLCMKYEPDGRSQVCFDLGRLYQRRNMLDRAQNYFEQAEKFTEEKFTKDSDESADALIELANILTQERKKTEALAVIEKACPIAERIFKQELKTGTSSKESYRRVLTAYLVKQELCRALDKDAEAEGIDKHLNELQLAKFRNFKLDPTTQDSIVTTAQELAKCFLAIKYNAKDKAQAENTLKTILGDNAQDALNDAQNAEARMGMMPHPKSEINGGQPVSKIDTRFVDISVESPDAAGLMTIKTRGVATIGSLGDTPFGYYFKAKPSSPGSKKLVVKEISEWENALPE